MKTGRSPQTRTANLLKNRQILPIISLVAAAALTAGCSGSGGSGPSQIPTTHNGSPNPASGHVTFTLGNSAPTKASAAHALYISSGMKSLVFVIQSAGYPDTKTKFDCSSTCSGSFDAPIGTDTFIIKTFDSVGGAGNVLSAGLTSLEVRAGIANQFKAVLGGIVARLSLALAPSAFTLGTPASGTLSVVPLDASGNTIIGSDAFATPVIVTLANGAFSLGNTVIKDASMASIPISYTGAIFSSPATVTATAAGLNVASLPLILASQTSGSGTNAVSGRTVAAGAFVDSIGVNTHFNYNGTPYTTAEPTVVADILALHIKHVREGMLYPFVTQPVTLQAAVHALSAAGVHDLAGIFPSDLTAPDFTTRWSNYFDSTGGSAWIEAVEAPNECDLNGCLSQATSYQQTIYSTVKGYGPSTSVTVLGPSFANSSSYTQTGSLAPNLDAGNIHLYTLSQPPETTGICQISDQCAGGANLNSVIGNTTPLDALLRTDAITSGSKPIINSESGICTTVDASGNTRYNDVPRDVQAAYWPRFLLHAFGDLGVPRTYMYELADDGVSPPDFDQCGLIDGSAVPKPSYKILKTILDAVNDPGPSFLPSPLAFSVATPNNVDGKPVSAMALASRNGAYTVFVWNPVSLWYQQSGNGGYSSHALSVAAIAGNLSLGKFFSSAKLTTFDLATGNATITTVDPSKPIPLSVTPAVTMVTLNP